MIEIFLNMYRIKDAVTFMVSILMIVFVSAVLSGYVNVIKGSPAFHYISIFMILSFFLHILIIVFIRDSNDIDERERARKKQSYIKFYSYYGCD